MGSTFQRKQRWKRRVRMFAHWCRTWLTWRVAATFYCLVTRPFILRVFGYRMCRGIRLIAYPPHDLIALREIEEALELIRRINPLRFHRVQRHIKDVVLADWKWSPNPKTLARYLSRTHECHFRKFPIAQNARFATVYEYLHLLVHEATHGLLDAKGFFFSQALKERIESICEKEERRFVRRLRADDLQKWNIALDYSAMLRGKRHTRQFRFTFAT